MRCRAIDRAHRADGDLFSSHGYSVLAFDYRHFGASTGEPRQLLDIGKQREDWHSALRFIRSQPFVDPDAVGIFGSSFGGGHVIAIAAEDPRVAAAIAQCPFTSGVASALTLGPIAMNMVGLHAIRDMLLGRTTPHMIPLAGAPGEAALMNAVGVKEGYASLIPEGVKHTGGVAARVGLKILAAAPGSYGVRVKVRWRAEIDKLTFKKCPIFYALCSRDQVCPIEVTELFARKSTRGEIKIYDMDHFEIYSGSRTSTVMQR